MAKFLRDGLAEIKAEQFAGDVEAIRSSTPSVGAAI
jgi:hypothetical protein